MALPPLPTLPHLPPALVAGLSELPRASAALAVADEPPRRVRTKLEPTFIPIVARALRLGLPLAQCAGLIGVTMKTLQGWRERGEDPNEPEGLHTEFAVEVLRARSEAARDGVASLSLHAQVDWKAQLELLRAQDPDTWAKQSKSKMDITVTKTPEPRDVSALSDYELDQLEALEAKMKAGVPKMLTATSGER